MEAILILAHGSKRNETEQTLNSIVQKVRHKIGSESVYPAYLQFSEQDMETIIKQLVDKGVKKFIVMPMFLFDGVHVTVDIPEEINKIKQIYSGIEIVITRHIGDDERIADIIIDRIADFSGVVGGRKR